MALICKITKGKRMKTIILLVMLFSITIENYAGIQRTRTEENKGQNGFAFVVHNHEPNNYCIIQCSGVGYEACPNCSQSIDNTGNEDTALHNYANNQIILGNLTGSQLSTSGLWKVKWEKKQNQNVSIVAWPLSETEPPLWP